ncbi:YwqI/YxiC family protein [Rossellomorea marisflavi]|uniref:YwqI/YxiC family protein n=1 Tax=Rossellomorea marisflavi TaxID=189381 RepID=UPI000A53DF3F|nr:YwqI/YxiC family protein [Rossellomorea marisflavi]
MDVKITRLDIERTDHVGTEIKIQYEEAEAALSKLRQSVDSWDTSFPKEIGGENNLEVINKLNELNAQCQKMLETYQELLLDNQETSKKSVEDMEDTDQSLHSMISMGR